MTTLYHRNSVFIFNTITLTILIGIFLLLTFNSLTWRMEHDTPLLHYAAYLIEKYDFVPYRDIFETSLPGTFFFHYAIGTLFGYGDLAFRIVDLTLLAALLLATYLFMSRFGRLPAIWAVILFGLVYLSKGQTMSLQRDYIGILPIAFSLLAIPAKTNTNVGVGRFVVVGLLIGCAAMIKPHLGLGLPVIFWALLSIRWNSKAWSLMDFFYCACATAISFLLPLIISVIWLASQSALDAFTDIVVNYLPMHSKLTGGQERISHADHIIYLVEQTIHFGGYAALGVAALFGYNQVAKTNNDNEETAIPTILLMLCTMAYAIYPTIAGKFWGYHYMPLAYFVTISTALSFYAWSDRTKVSPLSQTRIILPIVTVLLAFTLDGTLPRAADMLVKDFRLGPEIHAPKNGRVDEMADWLKSRLRPGDTVQPLDWTGGSIHAMLIAHARLATRFMYDYHFYHEVSSDYTQKLRGQFIKQLSQAMPRFIIEVETRKPWVSGLDTTREFPELKIFLSSYYEIGFHGDGYLIYERDTEPFSSSAQQVAPADARTSRR